MVKKYRSALPLCPADISPEGGCIAAKQSLFENEFGTNTGFA
jgi:hypothetical protein